MRIVASVLWQHAQLAAFLWAQREALLAADPPETVAVKGIDARLAANLDGLRIAGAAAWPVIVEQFESFPDKGELFVAAIHAIESGHPRRVELVVGFGQNAEDHSGLIGALGWLPTLTVAPLVRTWRGSADGFERYLAASALRLHRVDPGAVLADLLSDPDPRVRAEGCRIAAATARRDLIGMVVPGLRDADPETRFQAALSSVALGQVREALPVLKAQVRPGSPRAMVALRAVLDGLPDREGRKWLGELEASYETRSLAVRGLGMTGDATLLPWLVEAMADPVVAGAAAGAFQEINGRLDLPDDYFHATSELASAAYGIDLSASDDRFPIAAKFAGLISMRAEKSTGRRTLP